MSRYFYFILIFLMSFSANARDCKYEKGMDEIVNKISLKIASNYLGYNNVRGYIYSCEYINNNMEIKIKTSWDGMLNQNNYYYEDGTIKVKSNENGDILEMSYLATYKNETLKSWLSMMGVVGITYMLLSE